MRMRLIKNKKPLFIITGESNSGGQVPVAGLSQNDLAVKQNVKILNNQTLVFEPLQVGVNNTIGHFGLTNNTTFGMELSLSGILSSQVIKSTSAYLVKNGQGGSTISQWANGGSYWTTTEIRIDAVKESGKFNEMVPFIVLTLGINDAIARTQMSVWKPAVVDLISRWRSLLGKNAIVFATKFQPPIAERAEINAALAEIAENDLRLVLIDSHLALIQDGNHWNKSGMETMCTRVVNAIKTDYFR